MMAGRRRRGSLRRILRRLDPNTLFGRLLLVIVLSVSAAFAVASLVWINAIQSGKQEDALSSVQDLATSMASTVSYFERLPKEFQHLILDQQRNLGGTRFFLSVNTDYVPFEPIHDNPMKQQLIRAYEATFRERLGQRVGEIAVDFAYPQALRVFNSDVLFTELPPRWIQNNLVTNPPAPLLVAQMQMRDGDWLYLASLLLPDPYVAQGLSLFSTEQVTFIAILLVILITSSWFIVRWLTRPMRQLAQASLALGRDIHQNPLQETGTTEVRLMARAFNIMQRRILTFINDRDLLFSAISHDLKTPITRLRLRSELLDNDPLRNDFNKDLNELDQLVRGALELARTTDTHEKPEVVNLVSMLRDIQEEIAVLGKTVELDVPRYLPIRVRPMAMKRCLSNLIHNAVFYGSRAWVRTTPSDASIVIDILDNGPGVPLAELEHIFDPFVRLEGSRSRNTGGTGLGLTIARNIIHSHGGDIRLNNRAGYGLSVTLELPRS